MTLPITTVEMLIETLQQCQRHAFLDGPPGLHSEIAGSLEILYDYRVWVLEKARLSRADEECPPCIDNGVAHQVGMEPHITAEGHR